MCTHHHRNSSYFVCLRRLALFGGSVCVCVSYTQVIVDVYVVQPAQVLVRLQEAGELMMLSGRLGQ